MKATTTLLILFLTIANFAIADDLPPGQYFMHEGQGYWAQVGEDGNILSQPQKSEFRVRKDKHGRSVWTFVILGEHNKILYDASADTKTQLVPVMAADGGSALGIVNSDRPGILGQNSPDLANKSTVHLGAREFKMLVPLELIANADELGIPKRFSAHPEMLIQINAFDKAIKFRTPRTETYIQQFQKILTEDPKIFETFRMKQIAGEMKISHIDSNNLGDFASARAQAIAKQPVTFIFGNLGDAAHESGSREIYLIQDSNGKFVTKGTNGMPHVNIGQALTDFFISPKSGNIKETLTHELTHFVDEMSLKDGLPYGGRDPKHTAYDVKNRNFAFYEGSAEGTAAALSARFNEPFLSTGHRDISLNHGTYDELMKVPGMESAVAKEIIAVRESGQTFHQFEQITALKSVNTANYRKLLHRAIKANKNIVNTGSQSKVLINGNAISLSTIEPAQMAKHAGFNKAQVEEFAKLQQLAASKKVELQLQHLPTYMQTMTPETLSKLGSMSNQKDHPWRVAKDKTDVQTNRMTRNAADTAHLGGNEILRNEGAFSAVLNELLIHEDIQNKYEKPEFYKQVQNAYPELAGKDLSKLSVNDIKRVISPADNAYIKVQHIKTKYDAKTTDDFLNKYFQEYPNQQKTVANIVHGKTNGTLVSKKANELARTNQIAVEAYKEAVKDKSPEGQKKAAKLLEQIRITKELKIKLHKAAVKDSVETQKLAQADSRTPLLVLLQDGKTQIDLNKASAQDIAKIQGVNQKTAQMIVANRKNMQTGEYLDVKDVFQPYGSTLKDTSKYQDIGEKAGETVLRLASEPIVIKMPDGSKRSLDKLTSAELQKINGIGPAKADKIISYRNSLPGKRIMTLPELASASGIGAKTLAKLGFEPPQAGPKGHNAPMRYLEFKSGFSAKSGNETDNSVKDGETTQKSSDTINKGDDKAPKASNGTAKNNVATRAKASIRQDFMKGGIFADVVITAGMSIFNRVQGGGSFKDGMSDAVDYMKDPVFYIGDLMGGVIGAALGSAIPIPASIAARGLLGSMASSLPTMAGAMIMAQLGATAVQLIKDGNFSMGALLGSLDIPILAGQIIGATIGAALGNLIPIPGLGPIIGGLAGGIIGVKIAQWITGRDPSEMSAFDSAEADEALDTDNEEVIANDDEEDNEKASMSNIKVSLNDLYGNVVDAYKKFLHATDDAKENALDKYRDAKEAYESRKAAQATGN